MNLTSAKKLCRICLTQSIQMIDLSRHFNEAIPEDSDLTIKDALEDIMSVELIEQDEFPSIICPMCLSLLKVAYNLKKEFMKSQNALEEQFGEASSRNKSNNGLSSSELQFHPVDSSEKNISNCESEYSDIDAPPEIHDENEEQRDSDICITSDYEDPAFEKDADINAPESLTKQVNQSGVELIYKNNRFSLNDIVIVEEEESEPSNYDAFLSNLGSTVSAHFIKKNDFVNKRNKNIEAGAKNQISIVRLNISDETNNRNVKAQLQSGNSVKTNDYSLEVVRDNQENLPPENVIEMSIPEPVENETEQCRSNDVIDVWAENDIERFATDDVFDILESERGKTDKSVSKYMKSSSESTRAIEIARKLIQFKCRVCGTLCASKRRLRLHIHKTHCKGYNEVYMCDDCYAVSFSQSDAKEHMRTHTNLSKARQYLCSSDGQHSCRVCAYRFTTKKELKTHLSTAHTQSELDEHPEDQFLCQYCGHISNSRKRANYHLESHYGLRFPCNICGRMFQRQHTLKQHEREHVSQNQYLCFICGKAFTIRSSLEYHLKIHNNERRFSCSYCNRKFFMISGLNRHLRTHTKVRPYQCSYCDKCLFSKGERIKHEMLHTGQRPYHCKYCNRGFINKHNVKVHHLSHEGPFECDLCSKTFIEKEVLLFHKKRKHNVT